MKRKTNIALGVLLVVCTWAISIAGCSKNDVNLHKDLVPADSIEMVNKWVRDSMISYYFQNDVAQSVTSLNGEPKAYFKNLLTNADRFSWLSRGEDLNPSLSSFQRYGFYYQLFQSPDILDGKPAGVILYVAKSSPAANVGLKRGMLFNKFNSRTFGLSDAGVMESEMVRASSLRLGIVEKDSTIGWREVEGKSVSVGYVEDRPIQLTAVFREGDKRTGYVLFNSFNEVYDAELLAVIGKLKDQGISELILDLRYNTGGSVATAAKFSALLAPVVGATTFGYFEGNEFVGNGPRSFASMLSISSNAAGRSMQELAGIRPALKRVFMLTSHFTASSAELLINNLKPYIEVIQIGQKTYGKEFAGLVLKYKGKSIFPEWLMNVMVFKLRNANKQGDYGGGLVPAYSEDEIAQFPMRDMGSQDDLLLNKALRLIYGNDLRLEKKSLRGGFQKLKWKKEREKPSIRISNKGNSNIERKIRQVQEFSGFW